MKANSLILMFLFSMTAFPSAQAPAEGRGQSPPSSPTAHTPSEKPRQPSAATTAFVKDAAGGGMTEVRLAALAAGRAQRDDVKALAKMIKDDHERANQELTSLASAKQITLPNDLSATQKATVAKFEKLNGAACARAYVDEMVTDHRTDIAKFKQHTSDADTEVAAFVRQTLPALEKHLSSAEQAQKSGGQATGSSSSGRGNNGPSGR